MKSNLKKRKPQKPTVKYSQSLTKDIITRIANGETMQGVLKAPNMPTADAFYDWLARYPEHRESYHQARVKKLELMIEDVTNEPEPTEHELANPVFFSKMRDRRLKSVLWLAERLNSQIYGNHVTVEQKHTIDLKPLLDRVRESIRAKGLKTVGSSNKSTENGTKNNKV
ncbi:hypothetical protein HUT03_02155 [Candidatus Liberibacter africanus]|uniref:Terminase small subunit n=1 Tax=Candidatus Liberibacter africanus PTSAPSY TaxID=1277257 RepID=A0A0G3I6F0_LIBAF|nr:hypothetical protein [Candidatus Liberibacter africanus]AKK20068.1 hypothetical protein G293_02180 [Candidatus Liberibacter africanus PTSAPSY]QTP63888.1 hypothetical protein HUT03_02155 [Candidatus Liberibacter africanus]